MTTFASSRIHRHVHKLPVDLSYIHVFIYIHRHLCLRQTFKVKWKQPTLQNVVLNYLPPRGNKNKSVFSRRVLIPQWRYLTHFSTFQDSMVWTIHFKTASVSGKILDNSITAVTIMDFFGRILSDYLKRWVVALFM